MGFGGFVNGKNQLGCVSEEKSLEEGLKMNLKTLSASVAVCGLAAGASADEVSFGFDLINGTQSSNSTFVFNDDGATTLLTVILTNTMTSNSGPQWFTGAFFDIAGSPTMTYSGLTGTSMITLNGTSQTAYTTVTADHFWAYRDDLSASLPFGTQKYGLGAAGFDIFGLSDILNFQAGGPTPQPDGTDGGILADISGLQVPGGHEGKPFVLGSISLIFDLGNYDINNAGVSNVVSAFGTGFDEVVLVIPLPMGASMALAGLGFVAVRRQRAL